MNPFTQLPLSEAMQENLHSMNYKEMTPIQEQSIQSILEGRDVLAQAKTGSGKTAAFGIGLLHNLDLSQYRIQALILCPTRELADQVTAELRRLARFQHNIKILKLTGGIPMKKQELSLYHQAHIVVGTPGRIQKLLERESLSLEHVTCAVLDEADRMLDMGFLDSVRAIFKEIPQGHQTLLFSATFPEEIEKLSRRILKKPVKIEVESQHSQAVISQFFYTSEKTTKLETLEKLLLHYHPESSIIFCNTKDACRLVEKQLNKKGFHALALHGDLEQKDRTEILIRFSNGSSRILVATDVAARGLDIPLLGAVINYDLPFETETYIHRIGRTGRAGEEGLALSLMLPKETFRLDDINKLTQNHFRPERNVPSSSEETFPEPEMVTLSINGGRRNKISAGDILGALTKEGGIPGSDIGKIDRQDYLSFIAVKRESADLALELLENGQVKGKSFLALKND